MCGVPLFQPHNTFSQPQHLFVAHASPPPPTSHHIPRMQGGVEAIRDMYMLGPSAHQSDKGIYIHVTCATDTSTMSVVMAAVKDAVIEAALADAGLLV